MAHDIFDLRSIAYAWRLERSDGVTIGLTSHDRSVTLNGLSYQASPGMVPSAILLTGGIDNEALDLEGFITSDLINEEDLKAGRWDGAKLFISKYHWEDIEPETTPITYGILGSVSFGGKKFQVEFLGPAAKLNRAIAPLTSPTCRADFCDQKCGLNAAMFKIESMVASSFDTQVNLPASIANISYFSFGQLRWLSGRNCGFSHRIISAHTDQLILLHPPAFKPEIGDKIALTQGCDKTSQTCSSRFGNIVNFRGEPHLPGNDLLSRYPGGR